MGNMTQDAIEENKYNEPLNVNNANKTMSKQSSSSLQIRQKKNLLKYASKFKTAETEKRAVCDINFSKTNTDWFVSSYFTETNDIYSDDDGLILIWNLILPSFPEYRLSSQSMITSTHFHPTDQFLIFAATTSGQILCFDLRTGSNSKPVQRTNFSDAHSSAIFSMDFLQSAANSKSERRHILSVSNDGKLCIWKDDGLDESAMHEGMLQLHDKTKTIDEKTSNNLLDGTEQKRQSGTAGGSSTSQELSTTCFGYQYKHSDSIIFGSDCGKLYRTDIHGNASNDDGIHVEQSIDAHFGPVTNIDFALFDNRKDDKISSSISGLYLTSSYDWSVKLWHSDYRQCIESYSSMTDYVYDVKWCNGGKPGVFACCDGDNKVTLFDLKYDFKEPVSIISVPSGVEASEQSALTKLNWGNNGKYLCCGDSNGSIYLYVSSNELLYPRQSEYDDLDKTVTSTIKSKGLTKNN